MILTSPTHFLRLWMMKSRSGWRIAIILHYKILLSPKLHVKIWINNGLHNKNAFLEQLIAASSPPNEPFSVAYLTNLNSAFNFQVTFNAEIALRWQTLCIKNNVPWVYDNVIRFLTTQGRMKFVRPLYRLLRASSIGGPKVAEVFEANKHRYHPIARKMIEQDLAHIAASEAAEATDVSVPATAVAPSAPAPVSASSVTAEKPLAVASPVPEPAVVVTTAAVTPLTPSTPARVVEEPVVQAQSAVPVAVTASTPSTPVRAIPVEERKVQAQPAISTPATAGAAVLTSPRSAEDVVYMLQETAKAAQALVEEAEKVVKVAEKISSPEQSPVRQVAAGTATNGDHSAAPAPLSAVLAPAPAPIAASDNAPAASKHQPQRIIEQSKDEPEPKRREQTVSKINNLHFYGVLAAGVALGAIIFIRFRRFL